MTAKDIMTPAYLGSKESPQRSVDSEMPLTEVLPRLLDAPGRRLGVYDSSMQPLGEIDSTSMLEALGRLIAPRDDSSIVVVRCKPAEYSASRLAHAVEDADAHLVDLWSSPASAGEIEVTMRVRLGDPSPVVMSLERYGYEVVSSFGNYNELQVLSADRLLELQTLLNI